MNEILKGMFGVDYSRGPEGHGPRGEGLSELVEAQQDRSCNFNTQIMIKKALKLFTFV
jgi:hypothetical protein